MLLIFNLLDDIAADDILKIAFLATFYGNIIKKHIINLSAAFFFLLREC